MVLSFRPRSRTTCGRKSVGVGGGGRIDVRQLPVTNSSKEMQCVVPFFLSLS